MNFLLRYNMRNVFIGGDESFAVGGVYWGDFSWWGMNKLLAIGGDFLQ